MNDTFESDNGEQTTWDGRRSNCQEDNDTEQTSSVATRLALEEGFPYLGSHNGQLQILEKIEKERYLDIDQMVALKLKMLL